MQDRPPHVSLIIPAYNEEERIGPTLTKIISYLSSRPYEGEIVVVDDGSTDSTVKEAMAHSGGPVPLRVVENPGNKGKGYSVRHGMREGRGEFLIFSDADLSTPIEETEKVLRAHSRGSDVVVASRRLARSVLEIKQPWYREFMGRSFNLVVQTFAVRGISDTQCGFKGFTRDAAAAVFSKAVIDRFGFDVEILFLARKLGFTVKEIPVRWIDSPFSRVDPLRDPYRMFMEVLKVRKNDIEGVYRSF
jgi:dolichyl-phosphate beta-glucosyltransferase